jgi:3-hydroxyisobutyrate dehydrogenase-like beta-hydroxyacid dehydrogenase
MENSVPTQDALGFIGVGVMGEAMCRNLAAKSGRRVIAFDVKPEPLARLGEHGVAAATSIAELTGMVEGVFLCLPGEAQVREAALGKAGVLAHARSGQFLVDCSTAPPRLARELEAACAAKGLHFADAPIARTREAAQSGTLSIMVGSKSETFARIQRFLACMGSDITHCGGAGAGQVVKLLNNMVLAQNVLALAGALSVAHRAGVDERLLLDTLSKGSADSFALRNHGMKSLLPKVYPERAFSVRYMLKDLGYALDMARTVGVNLESADLARTVYERAVTQGHGDLYFPVVRRVLDT